jgi:hypothetical protein
VVALETVREAFDALLDAPVEPPRGGAPSGDEPRRGGAPTPAPEAART